MTQTRDITKTPPKHHRDITETPPRRHRDVTETSPRHPRDISKAIQNQTETSPTQCRNISETRPKHNRNILGEIFPGACAARPLIHEVKTRSLSLLGNRLSTGGEGLGGPPIKIILGVFGTWRHIPFYYSTSLQIIE